MSGSQPYASHDACRGRSHRPTGRRRFLMLGQTHAVLGSRSTRYSARIKLVRRQTLPHKNTSIYIEKKVDGIREATASSAPPEFTNCGHFNVTTFEIVCVDDVRLHIAAASSKHCALDPGSTWIIKNCGDVLSPFVTDIFNGSITTGHFPIAGRPPLSSHLLRTLDWTKARRQIIVQFRNCRFYRRFYSGLFTSKLRYICRSRTCFQLSRLPTDRVTLQKRPF